MVAAATCGLIFGIACVLVHYETLRILSIWTPRLTMRPRWRIVIVICGAYFSHLLQILLFTAGFLLLTNFFGLQATHPGGGPLPFDYALFYSVESFTSLGSSSTYPLGPLRLFAGLEGVIGLLLIGWSTSYTYLVMREYWDLH